MSNAIGTVPLQVRHRTTSLLQDANLAKNAFGAAVVLLLLDFIQTTLGFFFFLHLAENKVSHRLGAAVSYSVSVVG